MALVRKNFMVDADRVRALAHSRGISESAAVREAVNHALAADGVMAAIRDLHDSGAFRDFERSFGPAGGEAEEHSGNIAPSATAPHFGRR